MLEKPDVDQIEGLSPAISIDQKTVSQNPRSTVGTITEIYDYMRLLYARIGHPHCPECGREIQAQTIEQMVDSVIAKHAPASKNAKGTRILILSPLVKDRKGEYSALLEDLVKRGLTRARIDGHIFDLDEDDITLIKTNRHTIDAIVDRVVITKDIEKSRLSNSLERALKLSSGAVVVAEVLDDSLDFPAKPKKLVDHLYSENFACPECNISLPEIEPRNFSFNNPHGACAECDGIGAKLEVDPARVLNENLSILEGGIFPWSRQVSFDSYPRRFLERLAKQYGFTLNQPIKSIPEKAREDILSNGVFPYLQRRYEETESDTIRGEIEKYMTYKECPQCHGTRLKPEALSVTVADLNIAEVSSMSMIEITKWFHDLQQTTNLLTGRESQIAAPIMKELNARVKFLNDVGLDYLTLHRSSATLSGGESQRIRLASQIGSGLSGVLYVLDEPSIGLHPRDHHRLLETLHNLRNLGNTVIVVEHDLDTMMQSDWIVDFGPGAGVHGGKIIATGTPKEILNNPESITGEYMSRKKVVHPYIHERKFNPEKMLKIVGAKEHNLKRVSAEFPLGNFISVTGVSGSGKSTLVIDTLYKRLAVELNHAKEVPGQHEGIAGREHLDKVIQIDQTPIGRTPRSNAATYTGVFTPIRELFSSMPEAKARGYELGRFSFNVKGGRCENCQGEGQNRIEMQFLPDIYVTCETCNGTRYNRETLDIKYKDKNISEVLDLTVEDAYDFFMNIPTIKNKLKTLLDVGLGYIKLGQPAPTLSGGEAQRIKLSSELSRRSTGKTVYILDEPTTGLHFADIDKLLEVLHTLVDAGNTVIVIEHNLDVIKTSDWIIDLGPEGGDRGGQIIGAGTVKDIINNKQSYTGKHLKAYLEG